MHTWHYKWIIVILLVTIALTVTFVEAYIWCEEGNVANFHSIAGLWVSILGFVITIWTLIDTQRVSRQAEIAITKAAHEAETTVKTARRQMVEALEQAKRGV